jgi:cyclic pyranopterin phosphate synthase
MASEIKPISDTTGRIPLAEVVPLTTPYSVYIYPTTHCNFRCVYCAHSLGTKGMEKQYGFVKEAMNLDTYKKTIEQLIQFPEKIKMLSLTGQGEPLLNKNLPEMIRIAKETGKFERIEIISNGALLTPQLSDQLIESGLDSLRISLQGLSSYKYKEICGATIDFPKFIENLRYFYKKTTTTNLFVKVLDVALEDGEDEEFYKLFSDCTDRMFIEKLQPAYSGVELTDGLEVSQDRYGRDVPKRNMCPLAFFMLGVYPNGDIQPCDTLYRPIILGNVHSSTIFDMWGNNEHKEFWKLQLTNKRLENNGCSQCCAPTDISHPLDALEEAAEEILKRLD